MLFGILPFKTIWCLTLLSGIKLIKEIKNKQNPFDYGFTELALQKDDGAVMTALSKLKYISHCIWWNSPVILQCTKLTDASLDLRASHREGLFAPHPCGCVVQNRHFGEWNLENYCDFFFVLFSNHSSCSCGKVLMYWAALGIWLSRDWDSQLEGVDIIASQSDKETFVYFYIKSSLSNIKSAQWYRGHSSHLSRFRTRL